MDKYNDLYGEPNYTRLFLLFILFLVSMYFWMGSETEQYVKADYGVHSGCLEYAIDGSCTKKTYNTTN